MEGSSSNPAQGDPGMESSEWRSELSVESRQRVVDKIAQTLKKHLPISGPEGLYDHNKIAARFEEKVHTAATSLPDYLRKISLKMLTLESKYARVNPLTSNFAAGSQNPQDPGQGDPQNTSSDSQRLNQARQYEQMVVPLQHQQPQNQKQSHSQIMGKGKRSRMSLNVEEGILCSICLDPVMDNGDRSMAKLQCSHQFHLDCIGSAFNAKGLMQCPTCRRVEKGHWRFADTYRAFANFGEDD